MLRSLGLAVGAVMLATTVAHAQLAPANLDKEREKILLEIAAAEKAEAVYEGGAIKSLLTARLEVLRLSLALIEQRRIGTATGAKLEAVIPASKPDPEQVANIEREIRVLDGKVASAQIEAQKAGGLMRAMLESRVAAEQLSVSMLQAELLKAKYGIAWLPTTKPATAAPASASSSAAAPKKPSKSEQELPRQAQLLLPTVTNKRFRASDWRNGIHEDGIWFDVTHATAALPKPTRAVKGALVFADLFGEEKMRINWTINAALTPGKDHQEKGVGMKYNQFMDRHTWLRTTDLRDMRIWFEVKEIIYADGSKESFQE